MLNALLKRLLPLPVLTILIVACSNFHAFGQDGLPDVSISIDAKEIPLDELLKIISEKSGIPFSYNPRKIPVALEWTYRASNNKLLDVLEDVADHYGLTFEFIENQIILKPEKASDLSVTLSGTIRDHRSGEALIGASIFLKQLKVGAVTNAFGFYSLTVPPGNYLVDISYIGYNDTTLVAALNTAVRHDLTLSEEVPVLEEVLVSSVPTVVKEIGTSQMNIRPETVEERPEVFGEHDVVKSLESVPGVKFHSDGSTFYYVRGGHRDQNVVLIDDAPIYNPSHMLGMFSTLIPDAVNSITLYKGDMPASLGGRLSSVLDVRTKKGNDQHFSAHGSLGLISTKLGIEGPFKKGSSSYLLSGRFSSLGWIVRRSETAIREFNFHDLTGKLNFSLNENNRLHFSFYSGADNYFGTSTGISWSNNAATLQWNHLLNDRLFLNTTIAGGGYDYFLHTDLATNTKWNSHISNLNIKTDFSYFISPENELTFGVGLNGYGFNPGNFQSVNDVSSLPVTSVRNSAEVVLYGNHQTRIREKFGINYGVRLTYWTNVGEAFEFSFNEAGWPTDTLFFSKGSSYKQFLNAEPRVAVSYFVNERSSMKAAFSRNVQHVHLISNSISPFTSLDIWLPSSFNIKPQIGNQMTLGYYRNIDSKNISLSAEMFYKKMWNQIDYEAHAQILLNPFLESQLEFGTSRAYGLELLAKKDNGRLRGWIGYTWSHVGLTFPALNGGKEYNAFYDRPHQLNITGSFDASLRWQLAANWNYSTGAPYSSPVSFYSYNGEEVPVYGQKNNTRLPDYHRLDVSATYRLNRKANNAFVHHLSFSVFNLYGRKNPLFMNFNKVEAEDGSIKIPGNLNEVERLTSHFYLYGFTPSISYNFKWR